MISEEKKEPRKLVVRPKRRSGALYEIHLEGGGQVPDVLSGQLVHSMLILQKFTQVMLNIHQVQL